MFAAHFRIGLSVMARLPWITAACVLFFVAVTAAMAGDLGDWKRDRPLALGRKGIGTSLSSPRGERSPRLEMSGEIALEGAVDPAAYRLAPGDLLALSIWGATDLVIDLLVAADGSLVVPSVGVIQVDGKTLEETTELLRRECTGSYPHSEISLTLVRPALLRIPITGQVLEPGIYEVVSSFRLGDLIQLAGGLREGADSRGILIRGPDGEQRTCDLLAWMADGLDEGNPPLRSGDRVHVLPTSAAYRVRGVFSEGEKEPAPSSPLDRPFESETRLIPSRPGDNLDFVLRAAGALGANFCDQAVRVRRTRKEPTAEEECWVPLEAAHSYALEPGDIIEIPFCREWIAVVGAVVRPGLYPFLPGETVSSYVNAAGGYSQIGRSGGWTIGGPGGLKQSAAYGDTVAAGSWIHVPERRSRSIALILTPIGTALALVVSFIALSK